jgi:hypothetical protein
MFHLQLMACAHNLRESTGRFLVGQEHLVPHTVSTLVHVCAIHDWGKRMVCWMLVVAWEATVLRDDFSSVADQVSV